MDDQQHQYEHRRATIFALSSGQGRAGVAVIRVSGPGVPAILISMASPVPQPRIAGLRKVRAPGTGDIIDQALVLFFPGPGSQTGEDVAEFQIHGGRAVVAAMLAALASFPACRLAEPGEFARRAFENGKIDLTAAEGLADLVDAETEAQRRQALRQAGGVLARLYDSWRSSLIAASALVEAAIDFSDERDVFADAVGRARVVVEELRQVIAAHLDNGRRGEILREGFQVALVGAPNAGKSSLFNALAQRDAAIVSPEAGTTRDIIEVRLDLGGIPVVLADTAGLREIGAAVELEGMRRTRDRARRADLVLWVVNGAERSGGKSSQSAARLFDTQEFPTCEMLVVLTKADLLARNGGQGADASEFVGDPDVHVSAVTGQGIDQLEKLIASKASRCIGAVEAPALTQARHRTQLEACHGALGRFLAGNLDEAELRAEDLRIAVLALGRITGRVDVEDVLDHVFGRFCIGK